MEQGWSGVIPHWNHSRHFIVQGQLRQLSLRQNSRCVRSGKFELHAASVYFKLPTLSDVKSTSVLKSQAPSVFLLPPYFKCFSIIKLVEESPTPRHLIFCLRGVIKANASCFTSVFWNNALLNILERHWEMVYNFGPWARKSYHTYW